MNEVLFNSTINDWFHNVLKNLNCLKSVNPLTPMSDQENFSLQYQYNINQISDENKEKCKFGDNYLIQH